MESSRSRNGVGAGRAGAVVAIVAGLVALPPALAGGEDSSAGAPPPDADGIVGNEEEAAPAEGSEQGGQGGNSGADPAPGSQAPAVAAEDGEVTASDTASDDPQPRKDAAVARRGGGCPNVDAAASTLTNEQIARSILCLVNRERRQRNRARVARNGDLDKAARRHSIKMEAQNCFEHKCDGEPGLGKRVKRSGYTNGAERWRFAENLGCSKTTRGMIDGWMDDPEDNYFNRRNILGRNWEDIGVGIVHGSPVTTEPVRCPDTSETATYTLVFAFRRG
jgi:uncharacterized protein YkwD